ncbi:MAG: enoyl-CoA hydratase/isomerase family protein, partial [Vulcanimicrobiaceae bacterium]
MSERTRLARRDGFAVLAIDNPPVNALGSEVVGELDERVRALDADAGLRVVVLRGTDGIFSGGADIRGFGRPLAPGPTLRDVIGTIERSAKVYVAVLEGNALGGGLELAMACDYRVSRAGTRLGQPEIKLGLLPGAGGTQRLPRLIGLEVALEMIVGGDPIAAERASSLGLVDRLAESDLTEAAVAYVQSQGTRKRRARGLPLRGDPAAIAAARARVEPIERGGLAAHHAISAIEAGLSL